ncbi:MAG: hypothetical protein WC856_22610 [Methylococcaceae bacterium]|jgi:hypothetical protein
MKTITNQSFAPLEQITLPTVPTDAAAHYLNRRPQTLRSWACLENGPLRPIRINGRLAWSVPGIKALLECIEMKNGRK